MSVKGQLELSMGGSQQDQQEGLVVEKSQAEIKPPPQFQVILLNDDYTPMEFVVEILQEFFLMDIEKATQVMLAVHTQGKGVCGVYPKDIAETKAAQVNQFSRDHGHPLMCAVERVD